ncbi:MAG: TetR/AcrR family transcriptional regulator [Ferrovibrionaceae bacterium]
MGHKPGHRPAARLPRETRIAELMAAARQVFRDKGYDDASIAEIALRAGVGEGTLYRYFENKHDLLIKVLEDWYVGMIEDDDRQLRALQGTRDRLHYLIRSHLAVIWREPVFCRLVLVELRAAADYRGSALFQLNRAYARRTLDTIQEAVQSGEFRADVPLSLVRDMIYGCIEHHTWGYLRGDAEFAVDGVAEAITDMICRALAVPAARPDALAAAIERLEALTQRLSG